MENCESRVDQAKKRQPPSSITYVVTLNITIPGDRSPLFKPPYEWDWPTLIDEPLAELVAWTVR